jgi:hypothetical protein
MRHDCSLRQWLSGLLVTGFAATAAHADVTIQQQTTFDFSLFKAHSTATEYTAADRQRRDSDLHCEGFMSMLCGNAESGEIIRLDRDVRWTLEPKKKEYRQSAFPTEAQRMVAEQQAQAMMEKMKQCPAMQGSSSAPDTSKCQMGTPRFDLKQPGTHASFAGHDAQLTQIALTQSCTNPQTGDVCDFMFAFDAWLTQDQIEGLADRKAFQTAYAHKMGLDESNSLMQKQMRQFLAPYADSLKQLSGRTADLKGYPLKTTMRIAFGGERCGAAKSQPQSAGSGNVVADAGQAAGDAAAGSASSAAGSAAGNAAANAAGNTAGGSVLSSAASAFGSKLAGGLFSKKKPDTAPAATPTSANAPANGLPAGMVQAVQITVETTAITPGTVPATQFDIPTGWKLIQPEASKGGQKEFTCPTRAGG